MTPPEVFFDRRRFVRALGLGLPGVALAHAGFTNDRIRLPPDLTRHDVTDRSAASTFGHFSEFLPGRGGPIFRYVDRFQTDPWKVEIAGECEKPRTFDLDDLFSLGDEERVYHFRCVERWAMNVPWRGFPLGKLLLQAEPRPSARYVQFVSALRPDEMPGVRTASYLPWPYREGLRLDEAMHELTFVATGAYGERLSKHHGAPVRIVVPWKYGFKSPKSIVRIVFTRDEPETFFRLKSHENGFLANVNPNVPHARWGQEWSFWLDTGERFETPLFNGYESQVASLYPFEPRTSRL